MESKIYIVISASYGETVTVAVTLPGYAVTGCGDTSPNSQTEPSNRTLPEKSVARWTVSPASSFPDCRTP
jgi:hypothetical protein